MTVSIVKYDQTIESLRKSIELCDGFSELNPQSKVFLKPNIVFGGRKSQPSDGIVTTTAVMEELILLLREAGCKDITIGEGSIVHKELKLDSNRAFEWSGMKDLAQRLDVPLLDLNEGPFTQLDFDGVEIDYSTHILEADFVIDVPVLKTHNQTKVSLGLKNMKGGLSHESKKKFHIHNLNRFIALMDSKIPVHLTVIDGTFDLQKGPVGTDVHRRDLVLASKDILAVDTVGSYIMGIDPKEVEHLRQVSEMRGQSLDLSQIDIQGEDPDEVRKPLEWDTNWPMELIQAYNITGININKPGLTNCSGCGMGIFVGLNSFCRENQGANFDGVEMCIAQGAKGSPQAKKVFCLGQCACDENEDHPRAIQIKGCPPPVKKITEVLNRELIGSE